VLEGAQRYAQKGQYDKALKEYQKHLQGDPEDTNTRLKVGDIFLKLNDPQSAIEAYSQVAQQFSRSGFDAKAVAIYKQVLKVDAECLDARIKLGEHFQRMGLTTEALRELQDAVAICQKKGLKRDGFNLLKRVAELDPDNVPNRLSLADLLAREGLRDEARDEFSKLLDKAEADGAADLIVRVAEQMLACCADSERALISYATAKVKVGQAKDAVTKLSAALPSFDESIPLREALAAAHQGAGDNAKMQSAYREIAELYKRRGDNEKAREILQRFVPVEGFGGGSGPDTRNDVSFMDLRGEGLLDFSSDELGTGTGGGGVVEPREPRQLTPQKAAKPQAKPQPRPQPKAPDPGEGDAGYDELIAQARMERDFGDPVEARRYAEKALELEPNAQSARDILGSVGGDEADLDEDDGTLPDIELVLVDENDADSDFSSVEPPPELAGPARSAPAPAPASATAAPASSDEIEIDLDDLDLANADLGELEADQAGRDEVELPPASAPEPPPPAAPAASGQDKAASASWAQQSSWVVKTVKAAESILAKGMLDEAQMLYEQVLEHAPHHPQALLRLGEIAARKGQDPLADEKSFEDTFVDRDESAEEAPSESRVARHGEESAKKAAPAPRPAPPAPAAQAPPAAKAKPTPVPEVDLGRESFDALLQSVDDDVRKAPAAKAAPVAEDSFEDLFADEESEEQALGDPSEVDVDEVVSAALGDDDVDDAIVADTDLASSAKRKPAGDSATDVSIDDAELHVGEEEDDVIVVEPTKKPKAPEPVAAFDPASLVDEDDEPLEAEEVDGPDEDGFDLAAELDVAHPQSEEESAPDFADIFSAFKKGIEQQLSAEDAAAHYDLAIAYKEMGLLTDAVEALEKVQKQGPLGVEGISLLATCKLELGQPEAAIGLLVKALGKAATSGEKIALRYDLALAFNAAGQRDDALAAFQEVAKQDPSFREVQAQIEELGG
jgi:pilus assembly protein FimV